MFVWVRAWVLAGTEEHEKCQFGMGQGQKTTLAASALWDDLACSCGGWLSPTGLISAWCIIGRRHKRLHWLTITVAGALCVGGVMRRCRPSAVAWLLGGGSRMRGWPCVWCFFEPMRVRWSPMAKVAKPRAFVLSRWRLRDSL